MPSFFTGPVAGVVVLYRLSGVPSFFKTTPFVTVGFTVVVTGAETTGFTGVVTVVLTTGFTVVVAGAETTGFTGVVVGVVTTGFVVIICVAVVVLRVGLIVVPGFVADVVVVAGFVVFANEKLIKPVIIANPRITFFMLLNFLMF